ncbi:Vacuolar protein sorting-associated protein 9A [Tetrabaena socialis]|uniref:Vacuolar protein sorting-associated protein 9A n=1 Tax=Tetrabaena socialis TaxID=47790 RepID=A0A2J7ZKW2_9CHLO|nr:Vacuolar protein sorting-associated protein 9A [Tetrabaena socialis]|eukprot:PNH00904.1 Vacuolar protein sorting-associated protein 9A [Tetrabaena socialis]
MKNIRKRAPDSDADSREVQEFLTSMEQSFARHPLWAGSSRAELDNAVEGLEKYLMTKLYDRTFGQDLLDRERDDLLSRRLAALAGFVSPAHLEASRQLAGPMAADEDGQLAAAQKELRRMSLYKSPRDKLVQVLNCCKILNNMIASKRAGAGTMP